MSSQSKQAQQLARQLFRLSLVDGALSAERVAGVLEYVETRKVARPVLVLQAYHRLIAAEVAKGQALVEHAGPVAASVLESIASTMSARYGRKVVSLSRPNPKLIAGLRVRVGDDVFENSAAARLQALASAT